MDLDINRQFDLGRTPKALAQDFFLDLKLMFVARVLIVASAALHEIGAAWLDSLQRRLDDSVRVSANEAGLLLGDVGFYFFSAQNKWDEHSLSASACVACQAGEPIASVNHLFDCEKQGVILNDEN